MYRAPSRTHWLSAACLSLSGVAAGVLILQQPTAPTAIAANAVTRPNAPISKTAAPPRPAAKPKARTANRAKATVKARTFARTKTVAKAKAVAKAKSNVKAKAAPKSRAPSTPAIGYRKVKVAGVSMNVVQIDPKRPGVNLGVATAGNGLGYRDDWSRMIDRTRPTAAITG
ncbi:MAG: hypothetical protein ACO1SX_10150, partial [Actinomycetota bacterium]